jgi:hypothetical protein
LSDETAVVGVGGAGVEVGGGCVAVAALTGVRVGSLVGVCAVGAAVAVADVAATVEVGVGVTCDAARVAASLVA